MIKKIEQALLDSKTEAKKSKSKKHYQVTYDGKSYQYWKDYENDCWVFETYNGELSDTTFEDGCIKSIAYEIEQNS